MVHPFASPCNRVLATLPPDDRDLLASHLVPVDFAHRQKLAVQQRRFDRVYFPEAGIISVLGGIRGDALVEIGLIGREGIVNLPALLGAERAPADCLVQVAGRGFALEVEQARALMDRSPGLNDLVRRSAHAFMMQATSTIVAASRASLSQRLARWLLMTRDRLDDDAMPLTHDFLSLMLAVRRPSVTLALSDFERRGWIERRRGTVVLHDREALTGEANGYYGMAEQELDRAFARAGNGSKR